MLQLDSLAIYGASGGEGISRNSTAEICLTLSLIRETEIVEGQWAGIG